MKKKYALGDRTMQLTDGTILHRIQALKTFEDVFGNTVTKGDLGGWVQSEDNLSHEGRSWIYDDARAYGKSRVLDDAALYGKAEISDQVVVSDTSAMYDHSSAMNSARISGDTRIMDFASVQDMAQIKNAVVYEESRILSNAIVTEARIFGKTIIGRNATVSKTGDYICLSPIDDELIDHITFYKTEKGVSVMTDDVDFLLGMDVNDAERKVKEMLPEYRAKLYLNAIQFAKTHFEIQEQLANKEN